MDELQRKYELDVVGIFVGICCTCGILDIVWTLSSHMEEYYVLVEIHVRLCVRRYVRMCVMVLCDECKMWKHATVDVY